MSPSCRDRVANVLFNSDTNIPGSDIMRVLQASVWVLERERWSEVVAKDPRLESWIETDVLSGGSLANTGCLCNE